MTTPDIQQAREWVERIKDNPRIAPDTVVVAEVIQSLPDQIIDADKVRGILHRYAYMHATGQQAANILNDLESLLAPSLLTLAELIEAGNDPKQYQWMQADHVEHGRVIITHPGDTFIYYMKQSGLSGGVSLSSSDRITPLPDLPKMEWPAQEPRNPENPPAETLNNPSSDTPRNPCPEDVPDPQPGEAWLIEYRGKRYEALFWYSELYAHWTFGMGRKGTFTVESPEATPIARLVPEVKP